MSTRTQAADSYTEIAKRVAEIRNERMQAIVGCGCPENLLGEKQHIHNCPLRQQISITVSGIVSVPATTSSNLDKIKNWVAYRHTVLP